MATFVYSALKSDGSLTNGEVSAGDRAEAFRRLGRSGLQPVSLEAKSAGAVAVAAAPAAGAASSRAGSSPQPSAAPAGARPKGRAAKSETAARPTPKIPGRQKKYGSNGGGSSAAGTARGGLFGLSFGKSAAGSDAPLPSGPVRLKRSQVVLFTEELSDLLGAGLQLEPALKIMESRDELSNLKTVTRLIRQQVRDGASFSSSLRHSSPSFGELYCGLAAAGEVSGALPTILKRQAVYLVKLQELQSRVVVAMIYPACLMLAVVAVSVLFVSFLMPQLTSLLDSMGRQLPFAAQVLLNVSEFIKSFWWAIILLIIGGVAVFKKLITTDPYRGKWDRVKLQLPLIGAVMTRRTFVQMLETLSNLVANGLPLLKGLELTRNATLNLHVRALLDRIIEMVGEGGSLSRSMRKVDFFPPLLTDMIAVGEQTGHIEVALSRAAERYDKELEKSIQKLTALMQPAILIVLACIVGPMAYLMIRVILESISGIR